MCLVCELRCWNFIFLNKEVCEHNLLKTLKHNGYSQDQLLGKELGRLGRTYIILQFYFSSLISFIFNNFIYFEFLLHTYSNVLIKMFSNYDLSNDLENMKLIVEIDLWSQCHKFFFSTYLSSILKSSQTLLKLI